jgi:type IV secretion system protein VirB6
MVINWTTFATLYSALITPILAQLQSMLGNVCATMQPVALVMITAWLGFVAFDIANGTKTVQQAMRDFFVAGLVVVALQAGQYTQYVSDLFLQALPNTIGQAMGGTTSPVASLDTVLDTTIKAAATTYDQAVGVSPKTWPLGLAVIIFVVVGVAAVSYAFIIYMVATIINVVAVVVGPVFLALAAVPLTRRFAAGWFGVLVSGCVSQLLSLAVIRLLSGGEINMLHTFNVTTGAAGSNSITLLWGLTQCGILLFLCSMVVKEIPTIARAIAAGVYHGTQSAHAATFGAVAAASGAAAGASVGAARGAAGAIGANASRQIGAGALRVSTPVGPSLSRKS